MPLTNPGNIVELIEGCRNQQAGSQKLLYEQFFGYLLKIAFRYIYNYDSAVDITNDGFVKIFRNINKFRFEEEEFPERLLMGWMKRIIINTSIDALRKRNKDPETSMIPEHVWEQPDNSLGADQLLSYKDLVLLIKNLPPMYRIVFNMYVVDGCTHLEIANKLDISEGTSKSNLSRARAILQKMILGNKKSGSRDLPDNATPIPGSEGRPAFSACNC
jgi:RNA polymerase sigma-70 factor (ECF subfamily)